MAPRVPPRSAQDKNRARPARAIIKDPVPCCTQDDRAVDCERTLVPCGEYEIERMDADCAAGRVGLCSCATKNRFTLTFDSFLQHLNEGRIALARN
ncbi:MAG: hypothetical protein KDD85_12820 [Parvularculaceae bacterium]|nr:hypothetical protein [Parvularculaceae bacterium]